jgi:SAM-dependent methyltransferase
MNTPSSTIASSSHGITNDVVFREIIGKLPAKGRVLDFGAGKGHMAQRLGNWFEEKGETPAAHVAACEVVPEIFQYDKITCVPMGYLSEIPFPDAEFDCVCAIEVMEHTLRPYDFLEEALRVLKPGGRIVFSVPNILHFQARLKFLITGFPEMFGAPSVEPGNAGRICGHIMPLGFPYFVYGLRKAGFGNIGCLPDRLKLSARIWSFCFWPLLRIGTHLYSNEQKRYDCEVWNETLDVIKKVNQAPILVSRSCIMVAGKPLRN